MSALIRHRRVRHLHLRAASHDAAKHTAVLVEDALRIASWPGADTSRFLLIRRLDLGKVPSDAAPATLALLIEQRCREIPTKLHSTPSPINPGDHAISFTSHGAALTQLAQRLARGQSTAEWYWPLVLPDWHPNGPRSMAWRSLLQAALNEESAPMVAAEIVYLALCGGRGAELAAGLRDSDLPGVYAALGWTLATSESSRPLPGLDSTLAPLDTPFSGRLTGLAEESLRLIEQELPGNPPRPALRTWIGALLLLRHQPSLAGVRHLPQLVLETSVRRPSHPYPSFPPIRHSPPDPTVIAETHLGSDRLRDIAPKPAAFPDRSTAELVFNSESESQGNTTLGTGPLWTEDAHRASQTAGLTETTTFGGLLFVVSALQRLQFPRWLEDHPARLQDDFPTRLLLHLGKRIGLTDTDPLYTALATSLPPQSPETAADFSEIARSWIRQLRRWCRTEARLGLASLIRRPARLAATKTHLELFFPLSQVDLRIRRAGLDIDPGWVPWLGRVIYFHYRTPEEYDH